MLVIQYWRGIGQWDRAAALGVHFLKDNPTDGQLPQLRLAIARDQLAWAGQPDTRPSISSQAMLVEVSNRFDARARRWPRWRRISPTNGLWISRPSGKLPPVF